jgi:hypothetical protein
VPSASEPAAAGSSVQPQGAAAPNALVSTAIAPPPPEPPVAKQRGRANRRQKPAVDERNCPVTGSHEVTFESYPPGATVYLNGEHCGALGKTQLNVKLSAKLPPSDGTATRRFTAIFKRAGARTVTKEFEVLNITRIQRVDDRMPPRQ